MGNSFDLPTLFTTPWMQSLHGLSWVTNLWTTIPAEQLEKLSKNPSFLPQLNTLHYASSGMLDKLLTERKIVRLSGAVNQTTLMETHPNKKFVTHLSVDSYSLNRIFNSHGGIKQFCNLKHIGALAFAEYGGHNLNALDSVNRVFNSIVELKHLSSVDGFMDLRAIYYDDPWDQVLLTQLEGAHPKLCRIFLSGTSPCVWVRKDGSQVWERHKIPSFSSWDVVTDRYDHI
ncbi:hypothetical protein M408DRAFT_332987 [Serendipita vermifera MAFF 305830]|uniref:F-box domain-containing protein n=1 Tax=Serendipita vermifera MAFF 305830 TaxID=933852 RepID=A0A0C3ACB4_SERVB|nr:hypothetical protein M408DRAFT_332987 [Serendipita vermifera MAFF 305830]